MHPTLITVSESLLMKNALKKFLIIIFTFLTACSEEAEQAVKNFPRSENIKMNETTLLEPINSRGSMFTTDNYLVIYQTQVDSMYFRFYSLNDLHFVLGGGQRGRGPNEFVRPPNLRSFITEGDGFSCISTPFVKYVNIEGSEFKVIKQEESMLLNNIGSNNYSKIAENVYCISNMDTNQPYEFVLFDKDGANQKWVSPYPNWANVETREQLPFTYVSTVVANPTLKRFIVFYGYFKRVRLFNLEGKMLKDISVEFPFKFPQYDAKSRKQAYAQVPYHDNNYIYMISYNARSSEENESTELQIWNWNAEPIAVLNFDKRLTQFTISQEKRRIYAINPSRDFNNDKIFWCDLPDWLYK